ncbi:Putative AAA+ ATPase domain, P-loop containing nucleoside triphosphate hydrolase [Septoria linicola]|uniref:AAA+ ATPase domain, P-loop containing nucleoside triphosphate hydrolase n=1 Tax=Septoria linicola TaxID=215465 RepID=A0A9Q9B5D3_9PEZI|nr:putative AAA+ ATPase domain, P-loop containing nucleoside triphosphate hydrolase [Septoria linicola]USW57672.1 Putative AAA+ ATPase domain, P-loop containing nucleoside triphosphate hydrolase [Septoria linicola]
MASTILGKRTRGVATTGAIGTIRAREGALRKDANAAHADSTLASTRAKRRLAINSPNDENDNPFNSKRDHVSDSEDEMACDAVEPPTKRTRLSTRNAPSKKEAITSRAVSSPSTVNSHFKVGKSINQDGDKENTPQTPRRRDALSKKVPITPRHRILASKATPRSGKTPTTPFALSVYNQARQLFARCSDPGKLVGRDSEREGLSTFITAAVASKSTGCLYVSGPPGTGKSALLNEIIEEQTKDGSIPVSVVNCMSVRSTKDLSQKLSEDLSLREDAGFEYLKSVFVRGKAKDKKKYLVVLDEVDILVDLDLELLYSLFEWSMQPTSRLVLIGIANALDLTDRFLPRLKARNLKPELLPFMPYTAAQIAEVITSKLKSLGSADSTTIPFLHPAAIQFCAKKVAAQTGDLRKAFDICKRAIDLIDIETRDKAAAVEFSPSKTPLMENINLSSPAGSPSKTATYTVETAPKATIAHMAKVTAQAFSNGATQRLSTLNLQQKAVLCALAALERKKRESQVDRTMFATPSKSNSSAPSIKQLYDAYSTLCKRENLFHALSSVEFRDVVSGLETLSLVSAVDGGKNGSFAIPITPSRTPGRPKKNGFTGPALTEERRVASTVGLKELNGALDGPAGELLKEMLVGGALA